MHAQLVTTHPLVYTMSLDGLFEEQLARARQPYLLEEEPTVVVETTQGDEKENPALPEAPAPKQVAGAAIGGLLRNPDAHPVALDLVLIKKYGADWLRWEYETLITRITQDFQATTVADVNVEKIQACKALHLVDDFWHKWEVFNACVAALNGSFADFQRLQAHTVPECMLAVDIANRIRTDVRWSPEVTAFIAAVHQHDGILCPQPPLDFVHVPTAELHGDYASVRARWPEVRAGGKVPSGDSIEDEQLRRMLASYRYLEAARRRLEIQLSIV